MLKSARISTVLAVYFTKEPQCLWNEKILPNISTTFQELRSEFSSTQEREERMQRMNVDKTHTQVTPCGLGFLATWWPSQQARDPRASHRNRMEYLETGGGVKKKWKSSSFKDKKSLARFVCS